MPSRLARRPPRPTLRPKTLKVDLPPWLVRYLRDHAVPAVFVLVLTVLERADWINLLPFDPDIESAYGASGLALAVCAAIVASAAFIREGQDYGVLNFLLTVMGALAMLPPFILTPYGYTFKTYSVPLSFGPVFAYLGLHVAAGIFVGGIWTVILKTFYR